MRRQTQKGTTRNKSVCSLKRSTSGDDDDEEEEEGGGTAGPQEGTGVRPSWSSPKQKKAQRRQRWRSRVRK